MGSKGDSGADRKLTIPTIVFIVVLLLYPYPLGLLFAIGIPLGWPYIVAYAMWVLFGVLLAWLILRHSPTRKSRWPHTTAMKVLLAAALFWVALVSFFPHLVSPILSSFIAIPLVMGFLFEFAVAVGEARVRRDRQLHA